VRLDLKHVLAVVGDLVVAAAPLDGDRVAARPAVHDVQPAVLTEQGEAEVVVALSAEEPVLDRPAQQVVTARSAVQSVRAPSASMWSWPRPPPDVLEMTVTVPGLTEHGSCVLGAADGATTVAHEVRQLRDRGR